MAEREIEAMEAIIKRAMTECEEPAAMAGAIRHALHAAGYRLASAVREECAKVADKEGDAWLKQARKNAGIKPNPWAARNKPRYLAWAIERVGYRLPPASEG